MKNSQSKNKTGCDASIRSLLAHNSEEAVV